MGNSYSFDEIKDYIVGKCVADDYFGFYIYSNHSPQKNDAINFEGTLYKVESVIDDTTDEERDDGLSYSCVWMYKI